MKATPSNGGRGIGVRLAALGLALMLASSSRLLARAQEPQCANSCGDLAAAIDDIREYNRGDQVFVNVYIDDMRAPFFPKVDTFSVLEVPGTGQSLNGDTGAEVRVTLAGLSSSPKKYSNGNAFVGYYTLIASMVDGNVTSLDWDDGCGDCNDALCIDNTCGIEYPTDADLGESTYDVKVYLAWLGTDEGGRAMTSVGSIISNFRRFALNPIVQDAASVTNSIIEDVGNGE